MRVTILSDYIAARRDLSVAILEVARMPPLLSLD
jgi:hypothetical protein